MIKNYFNTGVRTRKGSVFSMVNITGLSLSIVVCLLFVMLVKDVNNYRHFHSRHDSVYRINTGTFRNHNYGVPFAPAPDIAFAAGLQTTGNIIKPVNGFKDR